MARMSIATIDSPEFINVKPYNPLISECEIKVMYIGENRNQSYISKEVATRMAESLPGCPIVGYYREDAQDFGDHARELIFEDGEFKFKSYTKPYGFVAPNAKVWFQKFQETDGKGNSVIREYLMTTGFLWTGQYPECQSVIDCGKPHSMELDDKTLDGYWSQELNKRVEFFIINDGIFSKLCILGDDVEPCFEGSNVTAPKVSTSFSKMDEDFKVTLFSMMKELKDALQEGGNQMHEDIILENENQEQEPVVEVPETEVQVEVEEPVVEVPAEAEQVEVPVVEVPQETTIVEENTDFSKDNSEKEDTKKNEDKVEDEEKEDSDDKEKDDEEEEEKKNHYSLDEIPEYVELSQNYLELQSQYNALQQEVSALRAFRLEKENEAKDALIKTFCMLSEDDIKEVVEKKSEYTLDEIEAKLAVIAVRKKINFSLDETESKENNEGITTFNLSGEDENVPAWIKAVRKTAQNR